MTVVGDPVEQGRGHLAITKHLWPFTKGQIGRDDERCSLIELGDQVKQKLASAFREGQVAQFVQDHQVKPNQALRKLSATT